MRYLELIEVMQRKIPWSKEGNKKKMSYFFISQEKKYRVNFDILSIEDQEEHLNTGKEPIPNLYFIEFGVVKNNDIDTKDTGYYDQFNVFSTVIDILRDMLKSGANVVFTGGSSRKTKQYKSIFANVVKTLPGYELKVISNVLELIFIVKKELINKL